MMSTALKLIRRVVTCAVLASSMVGVLIAQDDDPIALGEKLYRQCAACHQIGPDANNAFGPQLNGLMARGVGEVEDFDYSDAFEKAIADDVQWNDSSLSAFLESPMTNVPGTKMAFPGVKDDDDRAAIIAYLTAVDEDGILQRDKDPEAPTPQLIVTWKQRPLAADVEVPEHGVFHLGRAAFEEEVSAWDIDIRADGTGLPKGSGSATLGVEIYDDQCAACHGDFGEGTGRWPVLAGGADTLLEERPEKTIGSYWPYLSTVFDYVRRAMPFGNARSLTDDEVYAVTAYLMYLNDLVDEDFELNSENFNDIRLPNEENFIADTRAEELIYRANVEPCMTDCIEGVATVSQRAQILDVTPDGN